MFLYKRGAKVLFTYATTDLQLSWIYLKLRGSVPIGILAVAWESSTTGASQGPSVTTECECKTFSLTGCWVCTSAEHRLMSMGLLWFHPALLLRLHFPSFPEQKGRSRLELQRYTQTQTLFFPVLPVSPTLRTIQKAYKRFLFSDLLGWLFLACLNGSSSLTMNIQKTHPSPCCRRVKLWERRNAGIEGPVKNKYNHAREEGNSVGWRGTVQGWD